MNDRNRFRRFGRRPHIDLGPGRANHANTNYTPHAATPTQGGVSGVIPWCSRLGAPLLRGAIALRPTEITTQYRDPGEVTSPQIEDGNRRCSGPGPLDIAVTALVCPHPGDWCCWVKTAHPDAGQA